MSDDNKKDRPDLFSRIRRASSETIPTCLGWTRMAGAVAHGLGSDSECYMSGMSADRPTAELREADIQIGSVQLNPAQAIILRVAVTDLLTRLAVDHELRDSLGEVWQIYERRLREVQSLIVDSINAKPGH